MLNIKWDNGVAGYLSKSEKELCEKIDREISAINAVSKTEISVIISIEGGNQFHIKKDTGSLIGYMNAEQCWYALISMKYVPRNKYFELIGKLGVKKTESEYEIADLDLSAYTLNEDTKRIANVNFMKETEDRNGNYMLGGHWVSDLSYQFAKKCKFDLVQVDGYSSYAYSDEQMAVFTYTEGDIYLTLFTDKVKYEAEKERTIKFYEEEY